MNQAIADAGVADLALEHVLARAQEDGFKAVDDGYGEEGPEGKAAIMEGLQGKTATS
jgi:hypothetical protein